MQPRSIDTSTVVGWGIDADAENDPTYPMRQRQADEPRGELAPRPSQQRTDIEVLQSNERPSLPAVFGTSVPPRGVSGQLRRAAFGYSESSYGHWLPLMLADRVDMVEGLIDDLSGGHVPNIPAERGWGAAWKHDRAGQLITLGAWAVVAMAAMSYVRNRYPASRNN